MPAKRFEFVKTVNAEDLKVGQYFDLKGSAVQVCHFDGVIVEGFAQIGVNVDHPEKGRVAADLRVGQMIHVLAPSNRPLEAVRLDDSGNFARLVDEEQPLDELQRWLLMGGTVEGQEITLEGYGGMAGKSVQGTVLEKAEKTVKIELEVNGAKHPIEFRLSDGKAVKDSGDTGFVIPKGVLSAFKGNKRGGGGDTNRLPVSKGKVTSLQPNGKCLCGCGAETKARFRPGHDARFHSQVLKGLRGELGEKEVHANVAYEVNEKGGFGSARTQAATA